MNNQSWNEGLFEILCRSPGGEENTEKGLRENHHTSRTEGISEGRRIFSPKEFMEEDSRSFSLGSREHHQGTLRCGLYVPPAITTSAPESSLLGMGNSRELFSLSGVCETQRQEYIRTVHYTEPWSIREMIPNVITSGKALPPVRKEKGGKKREQSPKPRDSSLGCHGSCREGWRSPIKWNKIPTELIIRSLITPNFVM